MNLAIDRPHEETFGFLCGGNPAACDVLIYLIGVAQKTKGAEVWRALFAEMLHAITEAEKAQKAAPALPKQDPAHL